MQDIIYHYDALIDEGNDPVFDPPVLRDYMDRWDGPAFLDGLKLQPDWDVLEIGVGTGRLARRVLPQCRHLTGIDVSPKTIRRAEDNLKQFPNKTLLCDDFLTYSFSACYDLVYSSLTFFHIREKQAAISKVARLLKRGGRFALSISKDPSDRLEMAGRTLPLYPDSKAATCHMLAKAGFGRPDTIETEFAYLLFAQLTCKS